MERKNIRFLHLISDWSKILEETNAPFLYAVFSCDKKVAQLCTVRIFGRKRGDFCGN